MSLLLSSQPRAITSLPLKAAQTRPAKKSTITTSASAAPIRLCATWQPSTVCRPSRFMLLVWEEIDLSRQTILLPGARRTAARKCKCYLVAKHRLRLTTPLRVVPRVQRQSQNRGKHVGGYEQNKSRVRMSVDGSFIMANASHHSLIPREQFPETAQVNYGARKYLEELEQENGDGEPIHQQDKVSTTDPDSTYLTKGNRAAELGYFDNYLIDNESCVIVGVQATAARLSQESAAARDMIDRYYERYGRRPMGVAADNTYGNGELLQWLDDRGITPYIRVKEGPNSPPDLYGIEKFTYVPEENCYLCPAGKPLNYVGINKRNRAHRYYSTVKRCRGCGQKPQSLPGRFLTIGTTISERGGRKAERVAKTPEFAVAF